MNEVQERMILVLASFHHPVVVKDLYDILGIPVAGRLNAGMETPHITLTEKFR